MLVGLLAGWIVLSGLLTGRDPLPMLGMLAVALAAYVWGRATASVRTGAGVVGAVLVLVALAALPETFHGPPRTTPLYYENADAAWLAQGVVALVVVALSWPVPAVRQWAWGGAAFLVAVAAGLASLAGAALAFMVLLTGLGASRMRPGRFAALCAWGLGVVVLATVLLALRSVVSRSTIVVEAALSERRTALWHDALALVVHDPLTGVGPGGFSQESPTALEFPDTSETHSAYLQQAAETGLPGLVLLVALVVWAYAGLARSGRARDVAVVGIAGLTAFAVHAAVDYVAHFVPVLLTAAYLVGLLSRPDPVRSAAGGRGRSRG